MADLGAFFGNPNIQRQGARARVLASQRDVNTLPDPLTYAVMQGLLGTRPDEMGFSVLNPDYEKIKKVAEPAFALGLLGQAAPMLAPLTKGLPVGAGIKNIGSDIFKFSKEEFLGSPKITKNSNASDLKPIQLNTLKEIEPQPFMGGKYELKMNEDGAVVLDKGKPIASYNFGNTLVVDKAHRKSGIAQELVYEWRTTYPAPAKADMRTKASQDIQEKVWDRIQREKELLPQQEFAYPQKEALEAAQRNAVEYPLAPAGTRYEEFGGQLTYMTPDEYLSRVRPLELDDVSLENIAALKSHVQSGGQLDPLHIYQSGKEDGRHRAYMAKELGIEKIPVALHTEANNLGQNIPLDALSLLAEQQRKKITGLLE